MQLPRRTNAAPAAPLAARPEAVAAPAAPLAARPEAVAVEGRYTTPQPVVTSEDSCNQQICSGNKTKITCTSDTMIYMEKPPQGEEEKTTAVDQPVHASFTMSNLGTESSLEHLEMYNTLSTLPTGNKNNNHFKRRITAKQRYHRFCPLR